MQNARSATFDGFVFSGSIFHVLIAQIFFKQIFIAADSSRLPGSHEKSHTYAPPTHLLRRNYGIANIWDPTLDYSL